jgi:hypothetical protein
MLNNYFEKGGVPTYDGNMLINYFEKGGEVTVPTFVSLYTEFMAYLFLFGTNHAAFQYLASFHLSL